MTRIITTSWDDGHKLDLKLASLLKKYGIKGTFYISPNNREWERKNLLNNDQIKSLSRDFEIGAHTMTHPWLTKISAKEAFKEIKDSKAYLEKLIKKQVKMFCYPDGRYNETIKQLVKKAGFIGARTVQQFHFKPSSDPFELGTTCHVFNHRINISSRMSLTNNIKLLPSLFVKNWIKIAKQTFETVAQHGGTWHLWGHSQEIDKYGQWKKLEKILEYVSERKNFLYLNNSELLASTKQVK